MTNVLELQNIHTSYGRIPMLADVSLAVPEGEVFCVLGANGAGKSTLLRTIFGMVIPDQGKIFFEGEDVTNSHSSKLVPNGLSMAAAGAGSFPSMTVETNLKLGAFYIKDKHIIEERLEKIYESFPVLKERLQQKAGTLSGGERTMLSIGRALLSNPDLIMLDEPSLGLAPIMVDETFEIVKRLNQEENRSILLVEQNAEKALAVAHRGCIIQKGRIILDGDVEALKTSEFAENPVM